MTAVKTKLYVSGILETTPQGDLKSLFEQFGTVAECDIVKNYAFVHFENIEDAKAAVAALHQTDFMGQTIEVQESRSRVRQKPGMGGQDACFRCGKEGHWSKDCPRFPPRRDFGARGGFRGGDRGGRGGREFAPRRDPYGRPPPMRDPYDDPYYDDPYYRRPLPPPSRYSPYDDPYARRRPDPYAYAARDPYARPPPPDYYRRPAPGGMRPRDPYY